MAEDFYPFRLPSKTGNGDKFLKVNTGETGYEWDTAGGGGSTSGFSAYLSANQAVNSGSSTKVQFDAEDFDTNSEYDNNTNYRFTSTNGGKYQINVTFKANVGSGNYLQCDIRKNGSSIYDQLFYASGTLVTASGSMVVSLAANDYIEIFTLQNSGGAVNVSGAVNRSANFSMHQVG